jgi:hypothetical protein
MCKDIPTYYNFRKLFDSDLDSYLVRRKVRPIVNSFENVVKCLAFVFFPDCHSGDTIDSMLKYLKEECELLTQGLFDEELSLCEELIILGSALLDNNFEGCKDNFREIGMVSALCDCVSPNDNNYKDAGYIAVYSSISDKNLKDLFIWIIENRYGNIASRCSIAGFFYGLKHGYEGLKDFEDDIKKIIKENKLEYLDAMIIWFYCAI